MTFSFKIVARTDYDIISLAGELIDKNQSAELAAKVDELLGKNRTRLVFDLQDLKYINSSGLNVMINVLTRVRKAGGEVVITQVTKRVNELLIITKLNTVFTVTTDMETAVAKIKS
jgi:anti-sigma B factor antagonist